MSHIVEFLLAITFTTLHQSGYVSSTLTCPDNWYQIRDNCYQLIPEEHKNFTLAEVECRIVHGARLASVRDFETQKQLINTFYSKGPRSYDLVWIGLMPVTCNVDGKLSKPHIWHDGTLVTYSNWNKPKQDFCDEFMDEDDLSTPICTSMDVDRTEDSDNRIGSWVATLCRNELPFICERKAKEYVFVGSTMATTRDQITYEERTISIHPIIVALVVLLVAFIVAFVKYVHIPETFCTVT